MARREGVQYGEGVRNQAQMPRGPRLRDWVQAQGCSLEPPMRVQDSAGRSQTEAGAVCESGAGSRGSGLSESAIEP